MMRWPFMLRSTHDALMAAKDREIAAMRDRVRETLAAYDTLATRHDAFVIEVGRLNALHAERSVPPERSAPTPKLTLDPKVLTAIDFVAQGDVAKRRYLERYAKSEHRAGKTPEVVSGVILNGDGNVDEDDRL